MIIQVAVFKITQEARYDWTVDNDVVIHHTEETFEISFKGPKVDIIIGKHYTISTYYNYTNNITSQYSAVLIKHVYDLYTNTLIFKNIIKNL